MTNNQAIAYIRQLCCLGLGPDTAMAELVRTIKTAIPSSGNLFVGLNPDRSARYIIPEIVVPESLGTFLQRGMDLFPPGAHQRMIRWWSTHPLLDDPRIIDDKFFNTDYYNLVWRPSDKHHSLQAILYQSGNPIGTLMLFRPKRSPAFSEQEKTRLLNLLPYAEHALRGRSDIAMDFAGNGESGMFVMDCRGSMLFASETAKRLLALARAPSYSVGHVRSLYILDVPPAVGQLCRNLSTIFRGGEAPPPVISHVTSSGQFLFRAHWLDGSNREPGGLVGVTVEHRQPMALRLLRGMRHLPLSPTQLQVCLLLAQNHSHEAIARQLGIQRYTAQDHVRKIYAKLGVHQRRELVEHLLAQTETAS